MTEKKERPTFANDLRGCLARFCKPDLYSLPGTMEVVKKAYDLRQPQELRHSELVQAILYVGDRVGIRDIATLLLTDVGGGRSKNSIMAR